jgi:hypothetical protein
MGKPFSICTVTMLCVWLLSGCLYPEDRLSGGMEALPRHVNEVQQAVDRYQKEHRVLPIKTEEGDVPVYQKYPVDFGRLVPAYIGDAPPSSFEKGGPYMYVLIDVEEDPTVKLFDLRVTDRLRGIQQEINVYTVENDRYPRGMEIEPGVFELNAELLEQADVTVQSPYHPETELPLVMSSDGTVYVDYRSDLIRMIETMDSPPPPETDIRYLLTEDSLFAPAHSLPYVYEDGNVMFKPTAENP